MTYQELVDRSVASMGHPRKYKADIIDGYTQHHIIPRCMGGNNDGENIVYFTPAEHLMAHILLFRENPNNYKLAHAARMMSDLNDNFRDLLVEVVDNEDEFNTLVEDVVNAKEVSKARSPECRKKISEIKTGKPLSAEHRKILSEAKIGNVHLSAETRKKIGDKLRGENSYMFGVPKSEETKQKISESLMGKMVGGKNPYARAVICLDIERVFETVAEAVKWAKSSGIGNCCSGRSKTAGGYHWMYYDEYLANKIDNQ